MTAARMMSLHEAARAIAANAQGADAGFSGVSTDSRTIAAGELLAPLPGAAEARQRAALQSKRPRAVSYSEALHAHAVS